MKSSTTWKNCVFGVLVAALVLTASVQAEQVGVNFGKTVSLQLAPTDVAGVPEFEQSNWNTTTATNGTADALVDASGIATTMSVAWSTYTTFSSDEVDDSTPNNKLMKQYLDNRPTEEGKTVVTITGIPYGNYALIIYREGQNRSNARNGKYTVSNSDGSSVIAGPYYAQDPADGDFEGVFVQAPLNMTIDDATTPSGNYLLIEGLSAASIQIEAIGSWRSDAAANARAAFNAFQIVEMNSAGASNPAPSNGDDQVDSTVVNELTWQGPLTQNDVDGDPNLVSVDSFDIIYYSKPTVDVDSNDPNFVSDDIVYGGGTDVTSPYSISLDYGKTYFWRVDTNVTWDSNEFTGTASVSQKVLGGEWQFTTIPEYLLPVISDYSNVITATDVMPVELSASVSGSDLDEPGASVDFVLLTDDYEFPVGSDAVVTKTSADNAAPKAELSTTVAGTYKVLLTVNDGTNVVEAMAEVKVYADACQAKKDAPSSWAANYYDRDDNCVVDLLDFADFAEQWLDDTGMDAQETYEGGDILAFDADFIVEAETPYSLTDPNYVSEAPLEVNTGRPRINDAKSWVSGGQYISHTDPGHFITYEVNIPEAGDYTVMLLNSFPTGGVARSAALGTVSPDGDSSNDDIYAYGEIVLSDFGTAGWDDYKIDSTTVNFTAGIHLVRVTWIDGDFSVDLLAFKKQ